MKKFFKFFMKLILIVLIISGLGGTALFFYGDVIAEKTGLPIIGEVSQKITEVIANTAGTVAEKAEEKTEEIKNTTEEIKNSAPSPTTKPQPTKAPASTDTSGLFDLYKDEKIQSKVTPTQEPTPEPKQQDDKDNDKDNDKDVQSDTPVLTFTVAKHNEVTVPLYFSGEAQYVVNNDVPFFTDAEKDKTEAFESYSKLDDLGRCGVAYANICKELMPTEERGDIGSVKPTGWHTVKYNGIVEGNYLYNRCHLIGFQLAGENANNKNLITGTRYLNIQGMLDQENEVAQYVKKTGNHVLYRITPVFIDDELLCRGLLMEAWSVEDEGEGVCFCRYSYNAQPQIEIDYVTGDSKLIEED